MSDGSEIESRIRPGSIVADKYEILRVLGEGGVGIVVAARHLHLQRDVALKFLKYVSANDREGTDLFTNEARATFDIVNDHIVRVLDLDKLSDGTPFMVMELLDGCDLRKLLEDRSASNVGIVIELGIQICTGLTAAHALGVVHRDIKPENIFVVRADTEVQFKLLDFGISRVGRAEIPLASLRPEPLVWGTPAYMSPEQVQAGAELDQRSDVWSLGCVLYEMLTGTAPFARETVARSCQAVLDEHPAAIRDTHPHVDERLESIVLRCLSKQASERFSTAEELKQALEQLPCASERECELQHSPDERRDRRVTVDVRGRGRAPGRARPMASALVGAALGISLASATTIWAATQGARTATAARQDSAERARTRSLELPLRTRGQHDVATPSASRNAATHSAIHHRLRPYPGAPGL